MNTASKSKSSNLKESHHDLEIITLETDLSNSSFKKHIYPALNGKIFHSTSLASYHEIIKDGFIKIQTNPSLKEWNCTSHFESRGCISLCDLYHCKLYGHIRAGHQKYRFECPKHDEERYIFVLKKEFHDSVITWYEIKKTKDWNYDSIVPHIESGIKSPAPLSHFDYIYRITYPYHIQELNKIARTMALRR